MEPLVILLCAAIFVFALILGLISSEVCNTNITKKRLPYAHRSKEDFLATPNGAKIDPTTGALKGIGMITDGMLTKNWVDIEKEIYGSGIGFDGKRTIGVTSTDDGLDKAYNNFKELLDIDAQAGNGVRTPEDTKEMSKRLAVANNAQTNLFTRGANFPTKMILAPNEIRGVIDERYLPERDKNRQLAVVNTIVPIPGFDISIDRLGVNLMDTHFSNVSRNSSSGKRIPTASGAAGLGINKAISQDPEDKSPNEVALQQKVRLEGNNVLLTRGTGSGNSTEIVAAPLEQGDQTEAYRKNLAYNNFKVKPLRQNK
jgi:hypothetical protein